MKNGAPHFSAENTPMLATMYTLHTGDKSQLGHGTFGTVVGASKNGDRSQVVAVKIYRPDQKHADASASREVYALKALRGLSNVISVLGVYLKSAEEPLICLVFDLMTYSLRGLSKHRCDGYWCVGQTKGVILQLCTGLRQIHDARLIHRDLTPQNIMISADGQLRIVDFGAAIDVRTTSKRRIEQGMTPHVTTMCYQAPEMLMGAPDYGPEVDIWALGCIVAELILGGILFPATESTTPAEHMHQICGLMGNVGLEQWPIHLRSKAEPFARRWIHRSFSDRASLGLIGTHLRDSLIASSAVPLMDSLLTLVPSKRPLMGSILSHVYFQETPRPLPRDQLIFPC